MGRSSLQGVLAHGVDDTRHREVVAAMSSVPPRRARARLREIDARSRGAMVRAAAVLTALAAVLAAAFVARDLAKCSAAAAELRGTLRIVDDQFDPVAAAKRLHGAFTQISKNAPTRDVILALTDQAPLLRCVAFDREAAPWVRFVARLYQSVGEAADGWQDVHGHSPHAVPRVMVIGGGPAGLSAAIVARREGAT